MQNPLEDFAENRRDWQAVGVASGIGCTVVVSLLLCIGGGILLDRWLDTAPVLTLIGVFLGLATAGYSLYELAVLGDPKHGVVKLKPKQTGAGRPAEGEDNGGAQLPGSRDE
jgi:ATP synthase protein I